MVQFVLAVQGLQVAQVLLEDVDVWLQEGLPKCLENNNTSRSRCRYTREGTVDTAENRRYCRKPSDLDACRNFQVGTVDTSDLPVYIHDPTHGIVQRMHHSHPKDIMKRLV